MAAQTKQPAQTAANQLARAADALAKLRAFLVAAVEVVTVVEGIAGELARQQRAAGYARKRKRKPTPNDRT
jgi:hypothetical protein